MVLCFIFFYTILLTGVLTLPKRHKKRKNFAKLYKIPPPTKFIALKFTYIPILFSSNLIFNKLRKEKDRSQLVSAYRTNKLISFLFDYKLQKKVTGKRKERTNDSRSNSKIFNNDFNICFSVNFSLNLCKKIS